MFSFLLQTIDVYGVVAQVLRLIFQVRQMNASVDLDLCKTAMISMEEELAFAHHLIMF